MTTEQDVERVARAVQNEQLKSLAPVKSMAGNEADRQALLAVIIDNEHDFHGMYADFVDRFIAAGFHRCAPTALASAEDLKALAVGDAIRDADGGVFEKATEDYWYGAGREWFTGQIKLPAVVLMPGVARVARAALSAMPPTVDGDEREALRLEMTRK